MCCLQPPGGVGTEHVGVDDHVRRRAEPGHRGERALVGAVVHEVEHHAVTPRRGRVHVLHALDAQPGDHLGVPAQLAAPRLAADVGHGRPRRGPPPAGSSPAGTASAPGRPRGPPGATTRGGSGARPPAAGAAGGCAGAPTARSRADDHALPHAATPVPRRGGVLRSTRSVCSPGGPSPSAAPRPRGRPSRVRRRGRVAEHPGQRAAPGRPGRPAAPAGRRRRRGPRTGCRRRPSRRPGSRRPSPRRASSRRTPPRCVEGSTVTPARR